MAGVFFQADVNVVDRWCQTPLDDATQNGFVEVAEQTDTADCWADLPRRLLLLVFIHRQRTLLLMLTIDRCPTEAQWGPNLTLTLTLRKAARLAAASIYKEVLAQVASLGISNAQVVDFLKCSRV